MKLNINSEELMALYNLLYGRLDGHDTCEHEDSDVRGADAALLKQLYGRVKACIDIALSKDDKDTKPFELWQEGQQRKIDALSAQLEKMKAPLATPARYCMERPEDSSSDTSILNDPEFFDYPKRYAIDPRAKKKR